MGAVLAALGNAVRPRWGGRGRLTRGAWHDAKLRALFYQAIVVLLVVGVLAYAIDHAAQALQRQGIAGGFGYLWDQAGFGIGESPIQFDPSDSYLRAFIVGLLNTAKVSLVAIVAATLLGVAIGLLRLSPNLGVASLARAYVELFRNTPQLLQIIIWYILITRMPTPRQALEPLPGVFLSNRGIEIPWLVAHPGWGAALAGAALALALTIGAMVVARRFGRRPPLAVVLVVPAAAVLGWWLAGAPAAIDWPRLRGLNFRGGATLTPEFAALCLGLTLYIAAFVAEIVRGGILAVSEGQIDAARALGLSRGQAYRLVVLPQALRVIVPPLTGQYVSLAKNSSLAVAIGYPDVVNISTTSFNQSGHVVEAIVLMSLVYLLLSVSIALLMNWYNHLVRIRER